ncbi:hypothetical protein BN12_340016 [Nostocoides japonicum T1-X7]|uniref:Uncharacterized protein n=1 Tax=Nostocoides japonicum T1-X7 TaxID=1194083 RepID=A0A077LYR8_9MICO|nr:hypothetical protein BN12_340016 [Tetrasphaera japonica T1-X7]
MVAGGPYAGAIGSAQPIPAARPAPLDLTHRVRAVVPRPRVLPLLVGRGARRPADVVSSGQPTALTRSLPTLIGSPDNTELHPTSLVG